jgi:hypothetical protein
MRFTDPSGHMVVQNYVRIDGIYALSWVRFCDLCSYLLYHSNPTPSQPSDKIIGAFITGPQVPPLGGIPPELWPSLKGFAAGIGLLPTLVGELLLPSVVAYDVKNGLSQNYAYDAAATGGLTASIGLIIGGMASLPEGAGLVVAGMIGGSIIFEYVINRINHEAALYYELLEVFHIV